MKRIITLLLTAGLTAALATGCDRERTLYSGAEYVMFADTVSVNMIPDDEEYYFPVKIAATTACDYDRSFGVEIIDKGSKAIEGLHYRLRSNTVTIPAGKLATQVEVHGCYAEMEPGDTLNFKLQLVMPEQLEWDLYGDRTNVKMVKSCTFVREDFTGWCVVTSLFLYSYPGVENTSFQRLIRTEAHPTRENAVILKNWLFTGYDVELDFDPTDPANPIVTMPADQVISDETSVFGQINGDNKILVESSQARTSIFNSCQHFVAIWNRFYVNNLGVPVGTVGNFYTLLEWVSDEEADRLRKEDGM